MFKLVVREDASPGIELGHFHSLRAGLKHNHFVFELQRYEFATHPPGDPGHRPYSQSQKACHGLAPNKCCDRHDKHQEAHREKQHFESPLAGRNRAAR